ncbi:hypothetical protein KP509_35G035900 [Ceratopteris richardii]|uniref:BES1/BZR1 plant transcription factor N-terminal domain-containing protein n=1 Tax=Ceratopteris richardii TaxID=49495 RepID=A0A8T2QEI4_CERRI|nr:hypothetical protein KP509_35G035900 [Ceratopteris richardii]
MVTGNRAPTAKERERIKRLERKRREIAARIFAGLRQHGDIILSKHGVNNGILKAEAGSIVKEGTP